MKRRTEAEWNELVRDLAARIDAYSPGWTDHREGDPGIVLVQLFGFLAESILERHGAMAETQSRVREVLDRLESGADPCKEPLRRNRYSFGMVLGVDDFTTEQHYVREKHRRHNVHLHGTGVVDGLEVAVEPSTTRPQVTVSPGVALSPLGDELVVCEPQTSRGRSGRSPCYVALRLADHPMNPMPHDEASLIEERTEVVVVIEVPPDQLAIGRLERADGAWRVDTGFRPKRVAG